MGYVEHEAEVVATSADAEDGVAGSGPVRLDIHVMVAASEAVRRKLLFRDVLRADDTARDAWGGFKQRLASMTTDLHEYGQAKAGPTLILMIAAEGWASRTGWTPA